MPEQLLRRDFRLPQGRVRVFTAELFLNEDLSLLEAGLDAQNRPEELGGKSAKLMP